MKKKLLVLAMAGVMATSVLTACGSKESTITTAAEITTAETTTTAEATTTSETTEIETTTEATEEDKALTNFDEYISWTNKEWSAASDEEKLNAAIAYSVYTTEALGGEPFDAETKALTIQQMREAADIQNVVNQLDIALPAFADKSLKEFADIAVEQINGTAE